MFVIANWTTALPRDSEQNSGYMPANVRNSDAVPASYETHNTKSNSFLTKFCLAALPNSLCKETDALDVVIEKISQDFRLLFEEGLQVKGQPYFVGWQDWRWFEVVRKNSWAQKMLQSSNWKLSRNVPRMWRRNTRKTIWGFWPWSELGKLTVPTTSLGWPPSIAMIPFEPEDDRGKPEMVLRRDIFHNSKVGILRDYVGSSILLLVKLGYWNSEDPNEKQQARDMPGAGPC